MNMNRVEAFHRHYHTKVASRPDLYRSGDHAVDVILPNDLLEYANAASGHSGFGSGARARGIRKECRNSSAYLAEIFASLESLARFLESSEKNAEAYIETVRARHAAQNKPKEVMAACPNAGFWIKHTKEDMAAIKAKLKDHKVLVQDYQTMTLAAFEEKYALAA
jgi:hypothetical protein